MMTPEALRAGIKLMTGTQTWSRHSLWRSMLMTEGVLFLMENAEAYWLTDLIASHAGINANLQREHFQVWKLKRTDGRAFEASVTDGNDGPPIVTQFIEWSDFPLDEIDLWLLKSDNPEGWVLMLPSEY